MVHIKNFAEKLPSMNRTTRDVARIFIGEYFCNTLQALLVLLKLISALLRFMNKDIYF